MKTAHAAVLSAASTSCHLTPRQLAHLQAGTTQKSEKLNTTTTPPLNKPQSKGGRAQGQRLSRLSSASEIFQRFCRGSRGSPCCPQRYPLMNAFCGLVSLPCLTFPTSSPCFLMLTPKHTTCSQMLVSASALGERKPACYFHCADT